jgi:hypothetical protein
MARFGSFKIQGTTYDMDDLTLNEVEEIEERAGGTAFSELNFGSAKVMKAIAFVLMTRTNPDLTEDEVGSVKVIDFLPADEEMPETSPPDAGEAENPNGSEPAAAGAQGSVVSIAG